MLGFRSVEHHQQENRSYQVRPQEQTVTTSFHTLSKEHNGLVGELIQTEVQVLLQCNNENVVKMIKYLESENNCYMVMEYCNRKHLLLFV